MNQRLALLSAILANPDDDLPRLVFADWLDENGATDVEAARVEFIRLGCKGQAKSRISTAETKWLDANWQRLLGCVCAKRPDPADLPVPRREGKLLRLEFFWKEGEKPRRADVVLQYVRGFARRVSYQQGHAYRRFWQGAALDEPLAYHSPEHRPVVEFDPVRGGAYARLLPSSWGEDVYLRAVGHTEETQAKVKVFQSLRRGTDNPTLFHPDAVADEHGLETGQSRQRTAVATAMTSLAREFVGLAESRAND